ncbi:MAG: leucine-rich repeat domain-containing protein [Promethearchaeota archaeon]
MTPTPQEIKDRIHEIGTSEAKYLLKNWILNSNDATLRQKALEIYGLLEEGKNFKFFEQLFLSDENLQIRLIAGQILREKYSNNKKLIQLLEYSLKMIDNVELQLFTLRTLNSINNIKTRKLIIEFLNNIIKTYINNKKRRDLKEINELDPNETIPKVFLDICNNIILYNFYTKKCGYLVTIRDGKIISINCESSNLKKVSDILGIKNLIDLEYLQLARNKLERIEGIQFLNKLKKLDVANNKLKEIENLDDLINLEELNLSNNKIRKIDNLDSLHHLKKLYLDNNLIEEITNLTNLVNLEELNFSHNQISEIKNLDNLEKLNRLNLAYNQIEHMKGLRNLRNLMWLHLNDNKLTQISDISTLHQLKGLYLSNNFISDIGGLENQVNLKKMELSNNKIKRIQGLTNLKNLQELYLDNNSIEELEGFEGMDNLIILHIGRNEITKFNNESIKSLKGLNFLFLNENPLDKKSWEHFKERFKFP